MEHCSCESCKGHLAVLGLYPPVTFEEITQAHKDLVQVWHPDRFELNPRLREKAEEELKSVQEAYYNLKTHRSPSHSDNEPIAPVAVRKQPTSADCGYRRDGAFELTPDLARRLFKRTLDGNLVNLTSSIPFPTLLYVASRFGISDPKEIRVVMVHLEGEMDFGWIFTRSRLCYKARKEGIPFSSLSAWNFTLQADTSPSFWSDRFYDKLVGRQRKLIFLEAANKQNKWDTFRMEGVTDAHTQSIHEAILTLQREITSSRNA